MALLKLLLCLVWVNRIQGMHLTWDKEAPDYFNGKSEEPRWPNWMFIFPGTKWCGMGNVADDDDDLGDYKLTDTCCRMHDACDDYIEGYQTGHNLTNDSFHTRLSCECDKEFYNCLKSIDTVGSISIGAIYFNFLGTKCFKKEYPIEGCKEYVYVPRKKCIFYHVNTDYEKIYQCSQKLAQPSINKKSVSPINACKRL